MITTHSLIQMIKQDYKLSLANDCYKYIMDLTTNGVVITDAIKYVQTSREKLTTMSTMSNEKDNDNKESDKPDYNNEDKEIEEEQQQKTNNDVF